MTENKTRSALLVIDMENGFLNSESVHCIRNAEKTVPALIHSIKAAREKGIPIFFVKRLYRLDGSDVEMTRYDAWKAGNRAMAPSSIGKCSAQAPDGLQPMPGDYSIIKPRWSAFFHTELDLLLRRLGIRTVILTGTTTPNCIRTTAYDANSLEYNVVVLEDCCSSQTEAIQKANIEDMQRMGAVILSSEEFEQYNESTVIDQSERIRAELVQNDCVPEPFMKDICGNVSWTDLW